MKATQRLQEFGQSLRLDNITREMLIDGTLLANAAWLGVPRTIMRRT